MAKQLTHSSSAGRLMQRVTACKVGRAFRSCKVILTGPSCAVRAREPDLHRPTLRRVRILMLDRYVSAIRKRLPPVGDLRRVVRWANRAFDDFVFTDGRRKLTISALAHQVMALTALARNADTAFPTTLLRVCAAVDSGYVHLASQKLRSYNDISVQVATLRRLVDYIAIEVSRDSATLTE